MRLRDALVVVLFSASADPAAWQTPPGSPRLICFGNEPSWGIPFAASDQPRVTTPNASGRVPTDQTEAAMLEGRIWQLTNLPGHKSADLTALPRRVTLHFAEGRVTGFSGCNIVSGTYTTQGTALTLNLGSTLMACPEPGLSIERTFGQALKGTLSYTVKADRLTLRTASGAVLEFERAPAPALEGRTWNVTSYNNGRQAVVSPIPDTRLTLSFEQGVVSGQAGCNTFRATFSVQDNRVTIGPPATTRKACAEAVMAQERAFLTALESVARWTIDGGVLDMHRADDERALSAKPGDAK